MQREGAVRPRTVSTLLSFALLALCAPGVGRTQVRPLAVEDALRSRSFVETSPISLSPDGRRIAYCVRQNERAEIHETQQIERERYIRTGIAPRNEAADIWISYTETGETRNLTGGQYANWNPVWSPDGRYLAFLSDRDGTGQARLWIWDSAKDTLKRVMKTNVRVAYPASGIRWAPDSRHALVTVVPQKLSQAGYVQRALAPNSIKRYPEENKSAPKVIVFESAGSNAANAEARRASRYNLDAYGLTDLVLVDVETHELQTLSEGHRVGWYSASPGGRYIAYTVPQRLDAQGRFRKIFDFIAVDMRTGKESLLLSDSLMTDVFAWSPDGSALVYGVYEPDGTAFYTLDVSGGRPRKIANFPFIAGSFEMPAWDATGKTLYIVANGSFWEIAVSGGTPRRVASIPERPILRKAVTADGRLWSHAQTTVVLARDPENKGYAFYKIDLASGASEKLPDETRCYECNILGSGLGLGAIAAAADRIAFVAEDAQHSPDLWFSDFDFRNPHPVTHLNPQFDAYTMGAARLIDWVDDDGESLQGTLLLPAGYRENVRYPLVVYVYPTRLSNRLHEFGAGEFPGPLNLQLLTTRGYAVLLPDARDDRTYGITALAKSVLPGISEAVAIGVADPKRIGIMGHSAGGFEVMALLAQTNRFRAGMAVSGFGDYGGAFGHMDPDGLALPADEIERSLVGTVPWQNPFRFVANSPLYLLDRIETPLLLVHGTEDESASSWLSDQIFVGLRRLGRESEYARYEGETHVPRNWSYLSQSDLAQRMLHWFEVHVRNSSAGTVPSP